MKPLCLKLFKEVCCLDNGKKTANTKSHEPTFLKHAHCGGVSLSTEVVRPVFCLRSL